MTYVCLFVKYFYFQDTPKRGVCPFVFGSEICSSDASQESECQYDSDCMGDEKCCSDSCKAMKCVEVEPIALFSSHEKENEDNEKGKTWKMFLWVAK